jgi:hypothetical protein
MVEAVGHPHDLLARRPGEDIPTAILDQEGPFGHSLLGTAVFEVLHFVFEFYGFKTYNGLLNPSNSVAQAVLRGMIEAGVYFIDARGASGGVTTISQLPVPTGCFILWSTSRAGRHTARVGVPGWYQLSRPEYGPV